MTNGTNSFVQGIGVTPSENLPPSPKYFTQVSIPETVVIPCVKPDMEDLISVAIDADVISTRLIETAEGTSQEGQILLGRKLIVEVKLRQKVKYVADEPTQSVHAAHFEKVVSSIFVVLPKTVTIIITPENLDTGAAAVTADVPIEDVFNQNRLSVTPYIEDIYAVMRDKRTIFKNITVLLDVKVV